MIKLKKARFGYFLEIENGKKIAIVFEGRDAAGKGSTIKRFIENMMPKAVDVIELGVPTKKQSRNWFRTKACEIICDHLGTTQDHIVKLYDKLSEKYKTGQINQTELRFAIRRLELKI